MVAEEQQTGIRAFMLARGVVIATTTAIMVIAAVGLSFLGLRMMMARSSPYVSLRERVVGDSATTTIDREHSLPLATDLPQELSLIEDLLKQWSTFKHVPFESSGFSHLTLPFHFKSRNGGVNQREGFAFSFLLSNALDWVPGCYCSKHANFVAKRSRDKMISATVRYDSNIILPLIKQWHSTHAIGGSITENEHGYTGTLRIFDRTAVEKLVKEYARPRPYFDLLGDMCVDAMQFLGFNPSDDLVAHVGASRCNNHESITDLGRTAFAEERSADEIAIYRRILERDPGFGEVRYWAANQSSWKYGDRANYELQKAMALDSYLIEDALMTFFPKLCPDKELASKFETWIRQAERMIGADSPAVLAAQLELAWQKGRLTPEMFDNALQVASKYPNSHALLIAIADILMDKRRGLADCDLAASIAVSDVMSRYVPGSKATARYMMSLAAEAMMMIGRNNEAVQVLWEVADETLDSEYANSAAFYCGQLADALRGMGRHEESLKVRMQILESLPRQYAVTPWHVAQAGICASLTQKEDIITELLEEYGSDVVLNDACQLVTAYLEMLRNGLLSDETITIMQRLRGRSDWIGREAIILLAQVDILTGKDRYRSQIRNLLAVMPNDRELWILFDSYDRIEHQPDTQAFYESLAWLHDDDPWVRRAVKMFRIRSSGNQQASPSEAEEALAAYEPVRWPTIASVRHRAARRFPGDLPPGTVTVAVKELIKTGKYERAMNLALRYGHYASTLAQQFIAEDRGRLLRTHCNRLFRAAENAQRGSDQSAGMGD